MPLIWTTTNGKALTEFTGVVEELLLKPFDVATFLESVRRAVADATDVARLLSEQAGECRP